MSKIKDKSLESLAKNLEEKSEALETSLRKIQERLNGLGVHVEAWAEARLAESDWCHDEENGADEFDVEELGFAPYRGDWALLVRTRRFSRRWDSDYGRISELWFEDSGREVLLEAPIQTRIAAVRVLPELIEKLQSASREAIESITQAKAIAASLEPAR